jgi:DnaJ-class molecular chaperone
MKRLKAEDRLPEVKCAACNGTGFPTVKQPVQPGRKIYPEPCKECAGKGRMVFGKPKMSRG